MRVVVDIDGTIANIEHRLHFIQCGVKHWDEFHAASDNDQPIDSIVSLVKSLKNDRHQVLFWTGRSDIGEVRLKTLRWLIENELLPPGFCLCQTCEKERTGFLRMRVGGDHRPDNIIKAEWLQEEREAGRRVDLAIEDRQRVVDMWRDNGVLCMQVADGKF